MCLILASYKLSTPRLQWESCFIVHIWWSHNAFSHSLSEFLSDCGINHFANQKHKWHEGISPLGTKEQHMALKALRSFISKVYNLCINQYYWTDLHFSFILGCFSDLISLQMTPIMDKKKHFSLVIYLILNLSAVKQSIRLGSMVCCKVNYGVVLCDLRRT